MKFDRLLSTLLLLQRDLVPATELAEQLEVSVRTVYRGVEALPSVGVPVYAERGKYGGIRLFFRFRTDMSGWPTGSAWRSSTSSTTPPTTTYGAPRRS